MVPRRVLMVQRWVVQVVAVGQKQAVSEALVKLKREGFQAEDEALSGPDGTCLFNVKT